MKTIARALIIAVSAGLGLEAGSLWRSHAPFSASDAASLSSLAALDSAANDSQREKRAHLAELAAADDLKRHLSADTGVNKWLYWISALEKAKPEDFPRLARLARKNPAIYHFVVRRWIEVAPKNLFDTLVAISKSGGGGDLPFIDLGRELFQDWPSHDPKAVIAALSQPDAGAMDAFRFEVVTAVVDKDPEQGLQLMSQWHIENYGPNMGSITTWADANPQHAAEFALANPCGYASQMALQTIGAEWAKTDPESALAFATSQSGQLANYLATGALKQWAGQDLDAAGDWLATADDQTRNSLSPSFIEMWAKQDPQSALAWSQDNLQGIQLQQAVEGVMNGASAKDVSAAAAMVSSMSPGEGRTAAAGVVAGKWFPNFGSTDPVSPDTLTWISSLDPDSIKQAIGNVTWTWLNIDPKGMANFLSSINPNDIPDFTDTALVRQWARTSPIDALNWAATLPSSAGLSAGSEGFSEWRQSQPDAATAWLNSLPLNDPRRQQFAKQ